VRATVAYLPQIADIDRSFPIGVYDMVAMGLWREAPACSAASAGRETKVRNAIAAVGLSGIRGADDRHAVGRADAARAVSHGCCCRTRA
jgi:ABC-type Mn2+/Zn2+ transport system ATPase subunit